MHKAAEEELMLGLQNYLLCANSELLLKYRGEGFFHPMILIDISVANFSTKTNNKKNYSWAKNDKCYWVKIILAYF